MADGAAPGGRRFWNAGEATGTYDGGWGWGAKFFDADNDGRLDLVALNGFVSGDPDRTYWYALQEMVTQTKNNAADATDWPEMGNRDLSGHEPTRFFVQVDPERQGDRAAARAPARPGTRTAAPSFVECAARAGITDLENGRGVAILDADNDGALDLYVANQGGPSLLYRNATPGAAARDRWLGLALAGLPEAPREVGARRLASTTHAVGTRLEFRTNLRLQVREVQGGTGFAAQSEHRVHFGIAPGDVPEQLVIRWPSGRVQSFGAAELLACLGGYARLVEGGGLEPRAGAGSANAGGTP
jgi:alkylated DNA nucleotide flippase Atl1